MRFYPPGSNDIVILKGTNEHTAIDTADVKLNPKGFGDYPARRDKLIILSGLIVIIISIIVLILREII